MGPGNEAGCSSNYKHTHKPSGYLKVVLSQSLELMHPALLFVGHIPLRMMGQPLAPDRSS